PSPSSSPVMEQAPDVLAQQTPLARSSSAAPTQAPTSAPVATPVPTSPPVVSIPPGRYPATGTHVFSAEELQSWSLEELRYAINEIFARHGAVFTDKKIQKEFEKFAWYHPQRGVTFDQIEQALPDIERQNVQLLGNV